MINIWAVLLVLFTHWVADFMFQSREMGENKSHDNYILLKHSLYYGAFFIWLGPIIATVMIISHFCIDYVTSRGTTLLYTRNYPYLFWLLIGFDQWLHAVAIFLAVNYLLI